MCGVNGISLEVGRRSNVSKRKYCLDISIRIVTMMGYFMSTGTGCRGKLPTRCPEERDNLGKVSLREGKVSCARENSDAAYEVGSRGWEAE